MSQGSMLEDEMLRISEASRMLGVSSSTLRRWEQDGKLASFRTMGKHRRYRRSDIQKLRDEMLSLQGISFPK